MASQQAQSNQAITANDAARAAAMGTVSGGMGAVPAMGRAMKHVVVPYTGDFVPISKEEFDSEEPVHMMSSQLSDMENRRPRYPVNSTPLADLITPGGLTSTASRPIPMRSK